MQHLFSRNEVILGQKLTLNATETKSHLEDLSYNPDIPITHLDLHLDLI